jgi:hypothetical protein
MLSQENSKSLVKFLLMKFESKYKTDWEEERFSVFPHPCWTKHGKLDFDTIFYWKVYAQGYFAMRAGHFFSTLANQMGSGPAMIRHLASLSQDKDRLLSTYGQSKVLGWAVTASQRLVDLYPQESESYVGQWLSHCLLNKAWDGRWNSLLEGLNNSAGQLLAADDALKRVLQIKDFVNKFVLPPEWHLSGVGAEVLSFFFRDWKGFVGWTYFWKHDAWNEAFWHMVAKTLTFGLRDGHKDTVLAFLVDTLTDGEVRDGALAKINTTVYRLYGGYRKLYRELGEEKLRQELSQIS